MLHELSIENLGVIQSARVTFGAGLTVLTGETGAGKTMVLTGLGLILGGKPTPTAVRTGADEAVAQAVLDVPADSQARAALADAGAELEDDGTVIVARTVGATTRSRAIVAGRTAPQSLLADIASDLVTVHGQSDQVRLRSAARQRATLDEYAGPEQQRLLDDYRAAWAAWGDAKAELERMESGAHQARADVARLREDLIAIDAVDPQPGEDEALSAEAMVLENAESVRSGVAKAGQAIDNDSDEMSLVAAIEAARRALGDAARHDPVLAEHEKRLAEMGYAAADISSDLVHYLDALDADPGRLEALNDRRSALASLGRRIGRDVTGILEYAADARERVAEDDAWDETLIQRREDVERTNAAVIELAGKLSHGRSRASTALADAVNNELGQLAMPDARFEIDVEPVEPGPSGADAVVMTLAAHPGTAPRPVAEAASGGELSRIMLAIEVALADRAAAPGHTFVFDEVDAGVGGRAAIAVGNRLAALARTHQVIVVTHLAQVAAFANTHVVVQKSTDGSTTTTAVVEVTEADRVAEIARLLSGQEDSATARAHALELLEASAVAR
ncbi:DNA repair protein RecN [Demequina aurantiaca]|uniref:DNA repair protein RecN n=1 Tax=Demequina aurantiaca TaxID=676200 RepID=UPI000781ED9C|nr:DNA repair protein RecN [Demequina aurantiaca]